MRQLETNLKDSVMNESITKEKLQETVRISKRGATVTSTDIAKVFGKPHKNVLRMIKAKIDFLSAQKIADRKYFIDSSYIDKGGRTYQRYELTREGFDYVVLSFTGKKAELYKLWYIEEFHKKTNIIKRNKQIAYENNENPVWLEFRKQGKEIRTKFTDAINDYLLPQRIKENRETEQFVARYITSYTKLIYKILGIEIPKGAILNRDTMNMRDLFKIEQLEIRISKMIEKQAKEGIHYKKIYKNIKKILLSDDLIETINQKEIK